VRTASLLLALGFCLSAVAGQPEKVIYLPDSLSGLVGPSCLAFDRSNGLLYVAGDGPNVIAISESTHEKVARIDVGSRVNAICCDAAASKVYAALASDTVIVIDGASNTISARLPAGSDPVAIFYDSVVGKVYCGNSLSGNVTVIDAVRDSVVATIPLTDGPVAFCYDSTGAKVYCALPDRGSVAVLDGYADTLLRTITVAGEPSALLFDPQQNKVYCANRDDRSVSVISVLDDSVVKTVRRTAPYPRALALDPSRDRLYVACESREVTVVDCSADTVFARVRVNHEPWDVLYNGTSDRVYCPDYLTQLVVIDPAAETVVKAITVPSQPCALAVDADGNEVYCASATGNAITIVDASRDTVAATVATGCNLDFAVFSEKSGKLYVGFRFGASGRLAVIDGTSNVIRRFIDVVGYSPKVCYDSALDKIYIGGGGDSILTAIDCARDTIAATLAVPGMYSGSGSTCINPDDHKVYSTTGLGGTLTIVDAVMDTVITTIQYPSPNGPWEMCYNPANNLLYVHMEWSDPCAVYAIDGRGDSTVAVIHIQAWAGGPMVINPLENILYDGDGMNGYVSLIDCKRNQYLGALSAAGQPTAMCCDTLDNRTFVATLQGPYIWVFGGPLPPVVDSILIGPTWMSDIFHNPLSNRVYCASWNIYAIDAATECVIDSFQAQTSSGEPAFALNSATNRVYALDNGGSRLLVIADSLFVGLQDAHRLPGGGTRLSQTILGNVLFLPEASSPKPQAASLLDVSGRKVMDLAPGANDVRGLAPGVYFIRQGLGTRGEGPGETRKIILTE
jgi:YVTN family beta-propeller protein